jgi:hypothetical protein
VSSIWKKQRLMLVRKPEIKRIRKIGSEDRCKMQNNKLASENVWWKSNRNACKKSSVLGWWISLQMMTNYSSWPKISDEWKRYNTRRKLRGCGKSGWRHSALNRRNNKISANDWFKTPHGRKRLFGVRRSAWFERMSAT